MGFNFFDRIYVINLESSNDRKNHIKKHFSDMGINNYEFFKAVDKDSKKVKEAYKSGLVKKYPPCFRCNSVECNCGNNILIPQQIGNWLSFLGVMEEIIEKDYKGLVMICEDDIKFTPNSNEVLKSVFKTQENNFLNKTNPILIRMERRRNSPKGKPRLIKKGGLIMSNACFVINKAYAESFIKNLNQIDKTSDIYIQGRLPMKIDLNTEYYNLAPCIANQLSYTSTETKAKFYSDIHPKGIDKNDIERQKSHIKKVSNINEYNKLLKEWTK